MLTIINKLFLLLLLCCACCANAQTISPIPATPVTQTAGQKVMPVHRSYDYWQLSVKQRLAAAGISSPGHITLADESRLPTKRSYAMVSRDMQAKYPSLQRNKFSSQVPANVQSNLPAQRPFSYYQQQALMRMKRPSKNTD